MTPRRSRLVVLALIIVASALLAWTLFEARRQQQFVQEALVSEASLIARSIGAGLVAASHAAREIDEIVLWKLLDNARFLAQIEADDPSDISALQRIVEANGLDSVVFYDREGAMQLSFGDPVPDSFVAALEPAITGQVDEQILGSALEEEIDHLAVSVALPRGGAVLVRLEASAARTFVQRLGVGNLLDDLVATGGVLFLSYSDTPGATPTEATWDGGDLPPPARPGEAFREIRGRPTFEVEMPLQGPAGSQSRLRVGLDGARLQEAAGSAMRRTLLVGLVLFGFAVAGTAFAVVSRLRAQEREEASRQLARAEAARRGSERLAAAGALTAGLAHEVRSPLNAIGLAAQRLQRKFQEGDGPRTIAGQIRDDVRRLEGVLREFLELASPVSESRRATDLGEIAADVIRLLADEAEMLGVHLDPTEGHATAWAEPDSMHRALVNLLRNAIQASPEGSHVRVLLAEGDHEATLQVVDQGPGLDPELEGRLFDAFVTGRTSGTGLGLALVRRVAEEHGGTVNLETHKEGGAIATLRIPRGPAEGEIRS